MRVTNSMVIDTTLSDLNRALSRLQGSQTDLTTGRMIRRPSDDPTRASAAMTIRNQLRRADHNARSLDDAQAWLNAADTALVSGLDTLSSVKAAAVQAGNTGVSSPATREAIARSIDNMREDLLALANTKFLNRSVFNGSAAGPAYDAAGVYRGNDAGVMREIAPSTTVQVNMTGEEIFGRQTNLEDNVFAVLERLSLAVRAGDSAGMAAAHTDLDAAATRWSAAAAEIGSRSARVDGVQARQASNDVMLREALSELEDTDLAEALISVKANENAYTAALGAAAKVLPPSLLDFLR